MGEGKAGTGEGTGEGMCVGGAYPGGEGGACRGGEGNAYHQGKGAKGGLECSPMPAMPPVEPTPP